MRNLRTIGAISALAIAMAPAALAQDAAFRATTLNLSAIGEVRNAPDMATVVLGVDVRGPEAGVVMRQTNEIMTRVVAGIRAQGISDRDIQTTGINLIPQTQFPPIPVGQISQPITTYQASNTVNVLVRDLARVGPVIDAAVGAGGSVVRSVTFGLQNPGPAQNDARRDAVRDLSERAALYAQLNGYRVARIVSMNENQPVSNFSVPGAPAGGGRGGAAFNAPVTPVAPGEIGTRIVLSAVYELTR